MVEPLRAATLPEAPVGRFDDVAAPAGLTTVAVATSAVRPPPRQCAQRRRFELWLVRVCISIFPLPLSLLLIRVLGYTVASYSFRSASIGARDAARLAGYTPKRTPIARAMASAPTAAVGLVVIGSPMTP